jgi:hypothetical protein
MTWCYVYPSATWGINVIVDDATRDRHLRSEFPAKRTHAPTTPGPGVSAVSAAASAGRDTALERVHPYRMGSIAAGSAVRTSLIVVVAVMLLVSLSIYGSDGNVNLTG